MASPNSTPKHIKTAKQLDDLKGHKSRYEVADEGCPGLRVRVQPTGTRTYIWRVNHNGKQHIINIGRYPDVSLADARKKLEKLKDQHRGGDLFNDLKENPKTVSELADIFYHDRIVPHRKRPEIVRYVLDKNILPEIGTKKPQAVTTIAVSKVVSIVVNRGATGHAGKVLSTLKQLFKFAESRGFIEHSPAYSLEPKGLGITNNTRDRSLDAEEIRAFWVALDRAPRMSAPVRTGLRVLLLSGVRSGELIKAKWSDVDLDKGEWFVPEENSKTRAWTVPLSTHLLTLFKQLKEYAGDSEYVVPGKDGPVTDKVLVRAMTRLFEIKDKEDKHILTIPKATPHDLRRTMRSHMDDLKIEPHIAEKCLNHSLGRIAETYNTNPMMDQRREALEKWGDYVQVVTQQHDNVTSLEAAS